MLKNLKVSLWLWDIQISTFIVVHPNCWTKNLTIGVFCMTKYDYGLKKQVVKAYLNGEGGYEFISKKYGIPALDFQSIS